MSESIGQIQRKLDRLYNNSIKRIRVYLIKNSLIPRNSIGVKYKDMVNIFAKAVYNIDEVSDIRKWVIEKAHNGDFDNWPTLSQSTKDKRKEKTLAKKERKKLSNKWIKKQNECETFEEKQKVYYEYLESPEWYAIRKQVLIRDNKKCVKCKDTHNLRVHHKTYKNIFQEDEHLEDLITLCKDCHEKEHPEKMKTTEEENLKREKAAEVYRASLEDKNKQREAIKKEVDVLLEKKNELTDLTNLKVINLTPEFGIHGFKCLGEEFQLNLLKLMLKNTEFGNKIIPVLDIEDFDEKFFPIIASARSIKLLFNVVPDELQIKFVLPRYASEDDVSEGNSSPSEKLLSTIMETDITFNPDEIINIVIDFYKRKILLESINDIMNSYVNDKDNYYSGTELIKKINEDLKII